MTGTRPRLLVTTTTLPRFAGDPEPRFVLDLARHLPDFEVTILAPRSPGAAESELLEGVRVVRYGYAPFRSWETLAAPGAILHNLKANPLRLLLVPLLILGLARGMRKLARVEGFDLVHAHWVIPQGFVQAAFSNIPFVVSSHGSDVFALKSPLFAALRRFVLKRAAGVTVVSEALRQVIPSAEVIPMGVDLSAFSSVDRAPGQVPKLLFVGRLVEGKGLQVLLDALEGLPDFELVIAGDGPMREALEAKAAAFGDKVRFLGGVPHDRLPDLYRAADLFVMPSITSAKGEKEGLPVVLLEAAATGLPLIGSDLGGIPEVVRDGVTGRLVPEKDPAALRAAIEALASDPEMRQRCGTAARARAQDFGWTAIAARFRKVFLAALMKDRS